MLRDAPPLKQTSCSSPLAHLSRRPCPVAAVAERREAESRPPARPAQENHGCHGFRQAPPLELGAITQLFWKRRRRLEGSRGRFILGPGEGPVALPDLLAQPSSIQSSPARLPPAAAAAATGREAGRMSCWISPLLAPPAAILPLATWSRWVNG